MPSLQLVSSRLGGLHMPVMGSQLSWQFVGAGQVLATPARHVPVWQLSPTVHMLPSSQDVPFGFAGLVQVPVVGLHCLQLVGLLQSTVVPRRHTPPWQLSPAVHRFWSASQGVLLSLGANVQVVLPFVSVQVPGDTWQGLVLVQTIGVPVQTPAMHLS